MQTGSRRERKVRTHEWIVTLRMDTFGLRESIDRARGLKVTGRRDAGD